MDALAQLGAGAPEILLSHPAAAHQVVAAALQAAPIADTLRGDRGPTYRGYRIERGAALMPVTGALVPRGPVGMASYGVTSYEGLRDELRRASADVDVAMTILMFDSPGGYVNGVDATGDAILAARAAKPVVAIVEGMAASAAYWLAAQCDLIIAAPFAELGSIGCLQIHVEVSKALEAAGVKVTVVRAGDRKAKGLPFEPLEAETEAGMQEGVDRVRQAFAQAVVAGRDRAGLDVAAVLATEAAVFHAAAAVGMGLADRIGTLDGFLARMPDSAMLRRPVSPPALGAFVDGGAPLLEAPPAIVAAAAAVVAPEASAIPDVPAPSPRAIAPASPPAPAVPAGGDVGALIATERARVAAIYSHPFASMQGGRALADYHVTNGDEVDVAHALMSRMAAIGKETRQTTLEEEMAADVQPTIGCYGGGDAGLSDFEKGVMGAAKVTGKDPQTALLASRKRMTYAAAEHELAAQAVAIAAAAGVKT